MQQIRNMIKRDDIEADIHCICSEDFVIDDSDMNNDNNYRNDDPFAQVTDKNDHCTLNAIGNNNTQDMSTYIHEKTPIPESENNGIDHPIETNDVEMIDTEFLNDSITILENFNVANELNEINDTVKERNSFDYIMDVLRGTDDDMTTIDKVNSRLKT